jgi:glycosyltransferase involved in cell wall biosynthesis
MNRKRIRVLYSFPNKLGGARICYTAWQQVNGLAAAGADLIVCPASACRPVPVGVRLLPTLARGRVRIPFKLLGNGRAHALHDSIVARRIDRMAGQVDIIHTWPSGARRTLEAAARAGIPTVLERCSAHTRYAYEVVQKESARLGITLRPGDDGAFNEDVLRHEEEEFRLADRLLCPSDFVVQTFLDRGFSLDRLPRHMYGFDEKAYYPPPDYQPNKAGLRMLFVGYCAVGKGVHYALDAWLKSPAHHKGTFTIAGHFMPDYARKLAPLLSHPSVQVLGHRNDVPELMRNSDVLVMPSMQEGFGLVCTEAMASGCVPLVSNACTDFCKHMHNALVHRIGDVEALAQHISLLDQDWALLQKLRMAGLYLRDKLTWDAAGVKLLDVYRETIDLYSNKMKRELPTSLQSV